MKIPWSIRKKALVIVDVQPGFLNKENFYIVPQIQKLVREVDYNLYVECVFHAEHNSIWEKQTNWILPKDENFTTDSEILKSLESKETIHIEKESKSVFKGAPQLHSALIKRGIEEVHVAGLDANDCVLATAYEAFDLGYFTYVIEECTDSSNSKNIRNAGFEVLRHVNLTNNSCIEKVDFLDI